MVKRFYTYSTATGYWRMAALKEFFFIQDKSLQVSAEMMEAWRTDGAFIVRNLIPSNEMELLKKNLECPDMRKAVYDIDDGSGKTKSRLVIWNQPGTDVSGIVARSEKLVRTTEKLLGGEVYHYHSKLVPKQPKTGGVFQLHQDYGYWYNNGFVTPYMNTVFIAIDRCDPGNGCIEVMPGTHQCGRINHGAIGGQQGADLERVELIKRRFPLLPVTLDSGDALIFHSNVIHKSNANTSERRRWALLIAYSTRENESQIQHHCSSSYTPLEVVPDSEILKCTNFTDMTGKDFMDAKKDKTVGKVKYISPEERENM